jgi:hypothetical protein
MDAVRLHQQGAIAPTTSQRQEPPSTGGPPVSDEYRVELRGADVAFTPAPAIDPVQGFITRLRARTAVVQGPPVVAPVPAPELASPLAPAAAERPGTT